MVFSSCILNVRRGVFIGNRFLLENVSSSKQSLSMEAHAKGLVDSLDIGWNF